MKTFRKVALIALLAGVLSFLVVPLLIPETTSGTMTNVEAAGPDGEFETLAGLGVHVERASFTGNSDEPAPLIVLMHGFGASTYSWRDVIQPLAEFGDVIAYDRPGFGLTDRPTTWDEVNPYGFEGNFALLDDLIAKFGTGRDVVLVGHSAGGQLAAEYARLNPSKVKALILVDPAILTTGGGSDGLVWLYEIPQIKKLGPILVSSIATSGMDLLRESYFDQSQLTPEVLEGYQRPLKVKGWEVGFWNFATAPRTNELADNLGELKMPTLLITGSNDTVVPTSDTVKLDTLIPNSVLEIIEDSAHLPQEEKPQEFLAAILRNWPSLMLR